MVEVYRIIMRWKTVERESFFSPSSVILEFGVALNEVDRHCTEDRHENKLFYSMSN